MPRHSLPRVKAAVNDTSYHMLLNIFRPETKPNPDWTSREGRERAFRSMVSNGRDFKAQRTKRTRLTTPKLMDGSTGNAVTDMSGHSDCWRQMVVRLRYSVREGHILSKLVCGWAKNAATQGRSDGDGARQRGHWHMVRRHADTNESILCTRGPLSPLTRRRDPISRGSV